jgi:Mg-chelatase subunit ChlD
MLWGLAAASLPLIIHLINRHRANRRPFAAMDFLLRVKRRSARRILLRHILLLVARTLLIASLVIAAAGPTLRARESLPRRGPRTTALIIDLSLSMRASFSGRTFFDAAIKRARAVVREMLPGDRICLLSSGVSCKVIVQPCSDSGSVILDAIDRLTPQWGSSDLTSALQKASELLDSQKDETHVQARIFVLTDACAHAFGGSPDFGSGLPPRVEIENVVPDAVRDNLSIAEVTLRTEAHYLEVTSQVASYANKNFESVPLQVSAGDKILARGFADLPAGGRMAKTFNIQAPERAEIITFFTTAPDSLAADNKRLVHASGRLQIHALLVNGDMRPVLQRDELFYLENALSPAGEAASGIRFTSVTPDRFSKESLEGIDVVFLANVSYLSPQAVSGLRSFVSAGGGLFISLGARVDIERTNLILGDLLPWPLRDVVALGPADPDGVHRQGIAFADARLDHPALSVFDGQALSALLAVRSWRIAILDPGRAKPGSTVLLKYKNGAPALIQGSLGAGRVMLFTSTLDRDWNSWPARASYLPFIQRTCAYLAGRLEKRAPLEAVVGDTVRFPLVPESDGYRLTAPDGARFDLTTATQAMGEQEAAAAAPGHGPAAVSRNVSPQILFSKTYLPGWYQIVPIKNGLALHPGAMPGMIVHLPPRESDLRSISPGEMKSSLGEQASLILDHDAGSLARSRVEWFLLLALALLLLEAFLSRK